MRMVAATLCIILFLQTVKADERIGREEIKIGVLLALTGPYPMQGNGFREGIQLAEEEVNATGGINGASFKVVIEDTVNEAKNALTAAKKLIQQDRVVAALMSSYPEYKTGGLEFQKHKIPVLALWDSSPELDEMGEWIFGIGPWTPSSGEVAARFARDQLRTRRAVVINSVDPWAELISDVFVESFAEAGGTTVKRFRVNPDTNDFRGVLLNAKAQNAEVVFAPIIDHIPEFFRQKRQLGWGAPVISSDVIAQNHIDADPDALEGAYQTKNREPDLSSSKLELAYKKRFNTTPPLPWFVSTGYDGTMMIVAALRAGNRSGEQIRSYIAHLQDYKGETQTFSFTPGGSAPQMAVMHRLVNGKWDMVGVGEGSR